MLRNRDAVRAAGIGQNTIRVLIQGLVAERIDARPGCADPVRIFRRTNDVRSDRAVYDLAVIDQTFWRRMPCIILHGKAERDDGCFDSSPFRLAEKVTEDCNSTRCLICVFRFCHDSKRKAAPTAAFYTILIRRLSC